MNSDIKLYKEGLKQIWDKVVSVLGPMTTMIILKKAISQTQTQYPFLKQLKINEEGIDFNSLKIKNKKELEKGFEKIIDNFLSVLTNLTQDVLVSQIKMVHKAGGENVSETHN